MIKITDFKFPYKITADINGSEYTTRVNDLIEHYENEFFNTVLGGIEYAALLADWDGSDFTEQKYTDLWNGCNITISGSPYVFGGLKKSRCFRFSVQDSDGNSSTVQ